jgi:1-acyl-sn-glycerol-3-phosphate acyltransferase
MRLFGEMVKYIAACLRKGRFALLYVIGTPFAFFFAIIVLTALLLGRIRVQNYWRTWHLLRAGNVLIVSNHPSLLEAFATPALFCVWHFFGLSKCFPWNVADKNLLGKHGEWMYPGLRCVPITRSGFDSRPSQIKAVRSIAKLFSRKGTLIIYPEGGRTCKGTIFTTYCGRRVRECNTTVVNMSVARGVRIVPMWVEYGDSSKPLSIVRDFAKLRCNTLSIHFGEPIQKTSPFNALDVAEMLLSCGLE